MSDGARRTYEIDVKSRGRTVLHRTISGRPEEVLDKFRDVVAVMEDIIDEQSGMDDD